MFIISSCVASWITPLRSSQELGKNLVPGSWSNRGQSRSRSFHSEPTCPGANLRFPRPKLVWGQPCLMNMVRGEGRAEYRMLWPASLRTQLATRSTQAFPPPQSWSTALLTLSRPAHQSLQALCSCLGYASLYLPEVWASLGALTLYWTCSETLEGALFSLGTSVLSPLKNEQVGLIDSECPVSAIIPECPRDLQLSRQSGVKSLSHLSGSQLNSGKTSETHHIWGFRN